MDAVVVKRQSLVIEAEEMREVVLAVHSYAGMIGTAVADRMASRLKHLAYVDAVVPKPGETLDPQALLAFMAERVARWWLPDDVVLVDELPHTATGKLLKTRLREQFRGHRLPTDPA